MATLDRALEQMLGAIEKFVESAAPDAGALDDTRDRQFSRGKHLGRSQQKSFTMLRVAFGAAEAAIVSTSTGCGKLDHSRHKELDVLIITVPARKISQFLGPKG